MPKADAKDQASALDEREVERLYGLSLEEFLPARAELVKRLRADGHREAAQAAGRLRKPSVAAWAVDRLARQHPKEIQALFDANDRLRAAQTGGKRGAGPERMRGAVRDRQAVLSRLAEAARTVLGEAGHPGSRTMLDRVTASLLATAADPEAAELVRRGVLAKDLEPGVGFGALAGAEAAPTKGGERRRASDDRRREADAARRDAARRRAQGLRAEADRLKAEADRLDREAADAERAAKRARSAADRARRSADRATAAAADASAQADDA
jgi:hypothetical protein